MYPSAKNAYQEIAHGTAGVDQSGYEIVALLLNGALGKVALAKGHMQRQEIEPKGVAVSVAISIIDALQSSLDKEQGGEISENLNKLYDYVSRTLLEANHENNLDKLDEAYRLLMEVKQGWDGIKAEVGS